MIKLEKISKKYIISKSETTLALDDVSLTLPDRGLVFVLGKSGSGKSTLLNIIGGLDNPTSGDVFVDGNHINKLKEDELSDYCNNYLGFIFQDYFLLDNLTVYDNVKLALSLKDNVDDKLIDETLEKVGILEFKNRLPKNMSGGQKQRIVIARSIIKNPHILLCDEPTGNLDSATAKSILEILKNLSKNILVVIVSHNVDDAYKYADRIIEISDGRIINDTKIDNNEEIYIVKDQTLYLNSVNALSEEQIADINKSIASGEVKNIASRSSLFKKTEEDEKEMKNVAFERKKMPFKEQLSLSVRLSKRKIIPTLIVSIISAFLAVILGLAEAFTMFSFKTLMANSLKDQDKPALVMKKGFFDEEDNSKIKDNALVRVDAEDIETFESVNKNGEYYLLNNFNLPINFERYELAVELSINDSRNLSNFYLQETYGTVVTKESFLKKIYPDYEVIAGDINDKDYGLIITDYIADAMMLYNPYVFTKYEDIIGVYKMKSQDVLGYVNAIISTNYKERHKELIDMVYQVVNGDMTYKELVRTPEYLDFFEEVRSYLGVTYSFKENFLDEVRKEEVRQYARFDRANIVIPNMDNRAIWLSSYYVYGPSTYDLDFEIPERTFVLSLSEFNTMLNASYTMEEIDDLNIGHIAIARKAAYREATTTIFYEVVNLMIKESNDFAAIVSEDLFAELREKDTFNFAIYSTDHTVALDVYEKLSSRAFYAVSSYVSAVIAVNEVVTVFKDFFALVVIVLLITLISLLAVSAYISINSSKKQIGVLKALGMKNSTVSLLFIYQIILMSLVSIATFVAGIFIFRNVANNILFDSFLEFIKNPALRFIHILEVNPIIIISNILIIIVVYALTVLIPFLFMKRLKSLNIIRRGE